MLPDMSRLKLGPRSRPIGAGADEVVASVGDKRAAPAGSGGEEAAAEAPPPPEAVRRLLREAERVVQELREARVYSPFWQAEADALLEEAERLLLEQAEPPEAARALSDAVAALHAALLRMAALPRPPSMRQLGRAFDAAMDELRRTAGEARAKAEALLPALRAAVQYNVLSGFDATTYRAMVARLEAALAGEAAFPRGGAAAASQAAAMEAAYACQRCYLRPLSKR